MKKPYIPYIKYLHDRINYRGMVCNMCRSQEKSKPDRAFAFGQFYPHNSMNGNWWTHDSIMYNTHTL